MAINFPSSPSVNDTHTHSGKEWTWNGTSWVLSTNASNYTLPIATAGALGGIKVGANLSIDASTGVLSGSAGGGGGSTSPGGSDTHVQFNSSGSFAGDASLKWDNTNNRLSIGEDATDSYLEIGNGAPGTGGSRFSIRSNNSSNYLYSYAPSMFHIALATGSGNTIQLDWISGTMAQFKKQAECVLFYNNVERIKTTSDGAKIIGGIQDKDGQLGTSGQILSSTGTELDWIDAPSGSATTINSNADNRIITGSASANTLNAESSLTYDGNSLFFSDDKAIKFGSNLRMQMYTDGSVNYIKMPTDGPGAFPLSIHSGSDEVIKIDDGHTQILTGIKDKDGDLH